MNDARARAARFLIQAPAEGLSIDFANTRYWRGTGTPTETLSSVDDLLAWCRANAGIADAMTDAFRAAHPDGGAALRDALALREALYRLYLARAEGGEPGARDLALLREHLRGAAPRIELAHAGGRYAWAVGGEHCTLDGLLSPVLWSATDLLGGARLAKVKRCANDACKWLFVDDSKNGSRRWCSMSACGNRAKAHRHYHKDD